MSPTPPKPASGLPLNKLMELFNASNGVKKAQKRRRLQTESFPTDDQLAVLMRMCRMDSIMIEAMVSSTIVDV